MTTTTIANLNYSLASKNYTLIQLCELYVYETCEPIFRNFIHSVENSINHFDEINPTWRKLCKKGLNSAFGYFSKRPHQKSHKICSNIEEFRTLLCNETVTDFRSIGENFLDVDFESKETTSPNCFTNLTIGCYIVNYAKMVVDMKIQDIKEKFPSAKIYMINSDCIYFSTLKTVDLKCKS